MRKTCLALTLGLILASTQPSVAQDQAGPTQPQQRLAIAVDPPSPEASMTRPQQITHFRQIAESENATPPEREQAMKRLYHLYRGQGDQRRSEQWLARRNAFILEQERVILAGPALPAPPAVCTNLTACSTGPILRDFDVYWRYTTLAEAAEQRRDYARVIAMREAAIPFMHGVAPDASHWLALANDAREFAQYNDALRLCSIVSNNPIYEPVRRQGERCSADVRFAMDDFTGWLAHYEPTFTGPIPADPGGSVRYCIAATRPIAMTFPAKLATGRLRRWPSATRRRLKKPIRSNSAPLATPAADGCVHSNKFTAHVGEMIRRYSTE